MKTILLFATLCTFFLSQKIYAGSDKLSLLQSLKGEWSFSIGIDDDWVLPNYDDSQWETIRVPSSWEDQGFNGYNGYAFYRKKINISQNLKGRMLYLNMGYIDDVDEVYLNGHKIGSTGGFPPKYFTAYNAERIYYLPEDLIKFNAVNVIAVKVYDTEQAGGIVGGDIGIYGGPSSINLSVNLQTTWKFREGDDLKRKDIAYDDSDWKEVFVPGKWEDQGFRDYNGYGWYRKTIVYSAKTGDERLVIVLGKIDDIDEVYINGTLVGSTGYFPPRPKNQTNSGMEYNAFRGYYLPAGIMKNGKNVIAVRVLDTGGIGGIYEGPVGILSQNNYIEYWQEIKKSNY